MNIYNNKFQKSVNDKQCIGPCYPAYTKAIHPITLMEYTSDKPFCFTNEWYDKNNKKQIADICYIPEKKPIYGINSVPIFEFNCKNFLKLYYNISSFDDAFKYINDNKLPERGESIKSNLPMKTKLRIIECCLKLYLNDKTLNEDLIYFYIDIIKTTWLKNIQKYTKKISINDVTEQDVYNILNKYYKKNKNEWKHINNHNQNIKKETIEYFINKIKNIDI
jgi:hypothetical protein